MSRPAADPARGRRGRWRPARRRRAGAVVVAAMALAGAVLPAPAQEPVEDTLPADTVVADTVPGDTVAADTVPGDTARGGADVEEVQEGLSGGGFPERDSIFRRLAGEPGHRVVEYRGKEVSLEVQDRRIRLRDSAQTNYADAALQADSITYRSRLQFMSAQGHVRLASPDERRMTTDSVLYYDVSRLKGTVLNAHTSFAARGAEWQVRGDAVPVGSRTLYVNRGSFTSCERETPHYFFRAGKIKMVSQDVIVAWPVTLYISDVPVFWLPFFAQDIRPDRSSGIIPPDFGINEIVRTEGDTRRQIQDFGYFWAIDRFMDARFTVDWFSGQFTRLNGNFRYNFRKKFMQGNVQVSRDFADQDNLRFDASHEQRLTPDTRLQADVRFVTEEQLLRDRSFETEEQTQTIDSDVGLDHEFGFGNVSLSGRRQQFLGDENRVDLTLPDASISLSPVTLFEAPRSRAGFFENMTLSPGGLSFRRRERTRDAGDDILTTRASVGPSIRMGDFSLSTSGSFREEETTPFRTVVDEATGDTVFSGDLDSRLQSTVNWNASADYQVDLMGSTTFSPNVRVAGAFFRSRTPPDPFSEDTVPDTDGAFEQAPTRFNVGADLRTDLFGFYPGFGPFSNIRHKISPQFNWNFSPAASVSDSSLAEIPGFPGGRGETENTLSVSLNQTFEAKMPVETDGRETRDAGGAEAEDGGAADEAGPDAGDAAADAPDGGEEEAGDPDGDVGDEEVDAEPPADAPAEGGEDAERAATAGQEAPRERNFELLSIRSSALRFDFNRPGPALATDRFTNNIESDFFRGLDLTVGFDLLEGSGEEASFDPFLAEINASVSLRSGQSLTDLFGLGRDAGGTARGGPRGRPRGGRPGGHRGGRGEDREGAGPWSLSLDYRLERRRDGGSTLTGRDGRETIRGRLSLEPTPNWAMSWNTSYNIDEKEFDSQQVTLTRALHRWRARFQFNRAPNGNFTFNFFVTLTDAPELTLEHDTQSLPPR